MNKKDRERMEAIAKLYKITEKQVFDLAVRYFLKHNVNEDNTLKEGDNG